MPNIICLFHGIMFTNLQNEPKTETTRRELQVSCMALSVRRCNFNPSAVCLTETRLVAFSNTSKCNTNVKIVLVSRYILLKNVKDHYRVAVFSKRSPTDLVYIKECLLMRPLSFLQ